MADVFSELDEVMHQERMAKLWKDYGSYLIAFILAVILITAAFSGYNAWNKSVARAQTTELITLQSADNYPDNVTPEALSALRGSLKAIALTKAAGTYLEQNKDEKALALYEITRTDSTIPKDMAQLATIMSVRLQINAGEKSPASAKTYLSQLTPIASDEQSPWRYHALLETASIKAAINNEYDSAIADLDVIIKAQNIPPSLIEKAKALKHIYSTKSAK